METLRSETIDLANNCLPVKLLPTLRGNGQEQVTGERRLAQAALADHQGGARRYQALTGDKVVQNSASNFARISVENS
jgi:hypothetical protein